MIKLLDYYNTRNEKKKIDFFLPGIYNLLKNKLGFRYAKINKKGYYLKEVNETYEIVSFHKLKTEFKEFIDENYEKLEFSKEINYHDFMETYHKKLPIKNNNWIREYLGEDFELSDTNLHLIMLKVDTNYNRKYKRNEIIEFLKAENFIEAKGKGGCFEKDCSLFYRKVKENKFLIFSNPYNDGKNNSPTFDFWKINAHSEIEFLQDRKSNIINIKFGFELEKDIESFVREKNA